MRRWAIISAIALFAIFVVRDFANDFITNEPIRYFTFHPFQLLWVAAISIGGGLITMVFQRLSPRSQRRVKLIAIGSAASCLTVITCYLSYGIAGLSLTLGVFPGLVLIRGIAWSFGAAALLWFEFCRISKRRIT